MHWSVQMLCSVLMNWNVLVHSVMGDG
jgi:hypothetical protein